MTSFRIEQFRFTAESVRDLVRRDPRFSNWPVVYALDDRGSVYVGESRNAVARLRQHLDTEDKKRLQSAPIVIDDTFNKSVALSVPTVHRIHLWSSGHEEAGPDVTDPVAPSPSTPPNRRAPWCASKTAPRC